MIAIEVVLARPSEQQCIELNVPNECTAREAVGLAVAAGLKTGSFGTDDIDIDITTVALGVHGHCVSDGYRLRSGDRVELYRPLHQDPKDWRRRRAEAAKHQ